MKDVEWSDIHGEGDVICMCDQCNREHLVECDGAPDFRLAQREIQEMGWMSLKIHGVWHDFCCEKCRNDYIKEHS